MKRKLNSKFHSKEKMTVSNSPIIITTTDWIKRNDSMTLSGNKIKMFKMFKAHYSQEISKIPSLVSFLQLGDHVLAPQENWIGL